MSEAVEEKEPEYLNDKMLSAKIGIARVTLRRWRMEGNGPPFYKLGVRVVYDWAEVKQWLKEHRVSGGSQTAAV